MPIDIRRPLKRFAAHFLQARDDGLNEADTVQRLCAFFEEVLGYDSFKDISHETEMKNKYVDLCLKVDGHVRVIVEAKAAGRKLRDRHIEQIDLYASRNNYQWAVLTNGVDWHLYHLTFDEGIEYERAFAVSLGTDDGLKDAAAKLRLLHKHAIRKGELEQFWEKATALGPASIGKALFSAPVIMLIRRKIRHQSHVLIDREDLAKSIHEMLSQPARDEIGPVRIRKQARTRAKGAVNRVPAAARPVLQNAAARSVSGPGVSPAQSTGKKRVEAARKAWQTRRQSTALPTGDKRAAKIPTPATVALGPAAH